MIMTKFKMIAMGATVAVFAATYAAAGTFEKYGEAEGWNVFIDKEKMSCLIEKSDDLGNVVQMGLMEDRSIGYLGVFTKGEIELKAGDKKEIAVLLGDNIYLGETKGMLGNEALGLNGGYILTQSPQFVEDIAKQYTMTVFPEKAYAFVVDLTGTYKAIEMGRKCNSEN
jgi:hypothetical protein